jgi:ribonuclease P protein component
MRRTWTSLKRRADFLRIAASGLRRVTPAFILQAAPAPEGKQRIGFTCSRKVGNAVARNRAKRRLRAIADAVWQTTPVAARLDYVLVGRGEALTRDYAAMVADLRQALDRVASPKNKTAAPS